MSFTKGMLLAALICGSAISANVASAEEIGEFSLDTMIVTATRTEQNILQVPAMASVVTKADIEKRNINTLREALNGQAGIYIDPKDQAYGGIQMRGFDTTEILFLIDGQPVNNAWNGSANLDTVPIENIERIEVVRGAASSLYGGRAVGGVVNIISKNPDKKLAGNVTISYGSNDTWKKSINVGSKINDKLSFNVGFEQRQTDGYNGYKKVVAPAASGSTKGEVTVPQLSSGSYLIGGRGQRLSKSENFTTSLKYDFDANKSLKYTFNHSEYEYSYHNPYSYVKDASGKNVFLASGYYKTQNGDRIQIRPYDYLGNNGERRQDMHVFNYADTKNKLYINAGYQNIYRDGYVNAPTSAASIDYKGSGSGSFYPSKNYNLDLQKTWDVGKSTITAGFNYKDEEIKRHSINVSNWWDPTSQTGFGSAPKKVGGKGRTISVFLQDEYKFDDKFSMYLGGRYDTFKKYHGFTDAIKFAEEKFHEFSPKAVFEYKQDENTSFYVSYGHSFNTPTLYQVYRQTSSINANPDLKPETSDTFELGFKKRMNDTFVSASLFRSKTKDVVYLQPSGTPGRAYVNGDEGTKKGVELEVRQKFNDKLNGYVNYTWQQGEVVENTSGMTQSNQDIPKHLLHIGLDYTIGRLNAVLDGQFVSARQAGDAITGEYNSEDPYFVMNAYFNYKLSKGMTLQFGIDNVLDREYYSGEATKGRTYNIGLRYLF